MMRPRARVTVTTIISVFHVYQCQGWLPYVAPLSSHTSFPKGNRISRDSCNLWTCRRTCGIRRRPEPAMARTSAEGSRQEQEEEDEEDFVEDERWDPESALPADDEMPRVKMDETPLPEYIIDMLKKAGHIDEDGKPIDDPFDPFDEEEVEGTKSERLRQMKEQEQEYFDIPYGDMLEEGQVNLDDKDGLMDTTIAEASELFSFPLEFFHDVLTRWGVMPPIDEHVRLGDFVSPEQAFGLGEALHGLDPAEVRDNYISETVEDLAEDMEVPLPDLLQACAAAKINLPQGADTHLTIDDYREMLNQVYEDGENSDARRLFDLSLASSHYAGQKELELSEAEKSKDDRRLAQHTGGMSWKDGPPVIGLEEGQLHPDDIHISGKIFMEDMLMSGELEGISGDIEDNGYIASLFEHDRDERRYSEENARKPKETGL